MIPASPGTYVLVVEADCSRPVEIGALGTLCLEPGFYAYVGSALGPGGLAARIAHHRRRSRSPHWHIDYLRLHTSLREVWLAAAPIGREHQWARVLGEGRGVRIPLPRFGASDCRCPSHLFRFARPPRISTFRRRTRTLGADGRGPQQTIARWVAP